MSFLAPIFFVGLAAIAVPILVHLIQRERKDVVLFASLMFLQRIPYQSVERRRVHNWLLLLLRIGAMALIVAAFSRPFFTSQASAAAATTGAREVVILLDRSASMGYGDHWDRARAEATKIVDGLSGADKATLVLFARNEEEAVRATADQARLKSAIADATVSSDATRFAPALRIAQSLLSRSALPRKEAYLISDFQKTGWERQEDIHLPAGATLTPISVASMDTSDLAISSVALPRSSFASEERVTVTVGLTNRGSQPYTNVPVSLEIDGHPVGTRQVSVEANASASVTFPPFTVAQPNMRGVVRAGSDKLPADNVFNFVLSPSRPVSVLVVQGDGAGSTAPCGPACPSYYLTQALAISTAPPFRSDVLPVSRVTAGSLEHRSLVVLNDATALPQAVDDLLVRFVQQGGGLFIITGDHTPWAGGESPLLPGTLGPAVDRLTGQAGTLGFLDYSHPVFEQFKDPRQGNFSNIRFLRYRSLTPGPADRVLARFDDGAVAMAERRVGTGRVIVLTTPIDATWSDFPKRPMFLPLIYTTVTYLAQYEEPEAWYTVGRMLDVATPLAALVREGTAGETANLRRPSGLVMTPSGQQVTLGEGGVPSIELDEQGFYSVRMQGTGSSRPFAAAVNLDPAESDLTPLQPQQFVAAATGRAAVTATGQSLEQPELTPEDLEKKQGIWWFLLLAGVVALVSESLLSNRLSRRAGAGLLPAPPRA
jgi:Aerotolerance regulator N-terminal/von Willebrand factor type A domain/CARDB